MRYKTYWFAGINTSNIELIALLKSWAAISLAFSIALAGLKFSLGFIVIFLMAAITVGLGFLLHELAHKVVAQKYKCAAEFRSDDKMLILAIVLAFTGFIFAAPGAVLIHGHINKKQNGIISAAGPIANLILTLIFIALFFLVSIPFLKIAFVYGATINTWLALFNMIPFGMFDGKKILRWNKIVYGVMIAIGALLLFFTQSAMTY